MAKTNKTIDKIETNGLNSHTTTEFNGIKKKLDDIKKTKEYNKDLKISKDEGNNIAEKDFKNQVEKDWTESVKWREISKGGNYANLKYAGLPGNRKNFIEYRRGLGEGAKIIRTTDKKGTQRTVVIRKQK